MKTEKTLPTTDESEPQAINSPAPVLLMGLLALLVYCGLLYVEKYGGGFNGQVYLPYDNFADVDVHQPPHYVDPVFAGGKIFAQNCSPCHQTTGLGLPGQFPPLVASEWVNAKSPTRIIRAVLNGLGGPITVHGQAFNNNMVPWKDQMTDEQISYVLTFIRQNHDWSNDAPAVSPAEVKAIREKIKGRDNPFTPDELLKVPEGQ